ncbi:MAG: AmmeMemoRadiSam system protein A [Candidatus Anstonellales archaeon]
MGLSEEEKEILLWIARKGVMDAVNGVYDPPNEESIFLHEELMKRKGVFVTLERKGELQGCIGEIWPKNPLWLGVYRHAIDAAVHDPRFAPVEEGDLPHIDIEITILSVPEELHYSDWREVLEKLVPNKHGVVLKKDYNLATYLPQVWEHFPDKEEFLQNLAMKAGLLAEEWKKSQIFTYYAEEIVKGRFKE